MSIRRFVFLFSAGEVDTRFSFCAVACLSLLVSFSLFCMFMLYIYVCIIYIWVSQSSGAV